MVDKAGKASFMETVRYADGHDMCLMALGVLGSFGDGMMQPLSMLVLGDIVNSYGGASSSGGFSSSTVDKVKTYCTSLLHEILWRAYSCRAWC